MALAFVKRPNDKNVRRETAISSLNEAGEADTSHIQTSHSFRDHESSISVLRHQFSRFSSTLRFSTIVFVGFWRTVRKRASLVRRKDNQPRSGICAHIPPLPSLSSDAASWKLTKLTNWLWRRLIGILTVQFCGSMLQ